MEEQEKLVLILSLGVVVLVLSVLLTFFHHKERKCCRVCSSEEIVEETEAAEEDQSPKVAFRNDEIVVVAVDEQNLKELEAFRLAFERVMFVRIVAKGAFGEVWYGHFLNQTVAIKKLVDSKRHHQLHLANFIKEISRMAQLVHPNIVRFVGCAWSQPSDLCALTEFMDRGDLHNVLTRKSSRNLTWENDGGKILIAQNVIDALAYLHGLKIIHRDLKSRNIMIDSYAGAKLSDFGISKLREFDNQSMTIGMGTARWIAPEVISTKRYDQKSDIYSFGVVLAEIDTHKLPYQDLKRGDDLQDFLILHRVGQGKLKPSFSANCKPYILDIANKCLQFNPALRPSAEEVSLMLRRKSATLE